MLPPLYPFERPWYETLQEAVMAARLRSALFDTLPYLQGADEHYDFSLSGETPPWYAPKFAVNPYTVR
jgi:hypothetical protein